MGSKTKTKACVYCGSSETLTVEHVVPIGHWRKYGIKRSVLDNPSNRVSACLKCNREKGGMSPRAWLALHPEYEKRFRREAKYLSDAVKEIAGLK